MKKFNLLLFAVAWLFVAPVTSYAQWQQTNGPYGGIINCFADSGSNLFAGTNGGYN